MNQGFTFVRGSRYHKAKLVKTASSKALQISLLLLTVAGVVGGAYLLLVNLKFGYSLLGLAIIPAMLRTWLRRDILRLDENAPANIQSGRIDELVTADLVEVVANAQTPQALWGSLHDYWQHRFIINRFGLDHHYINSVVSPNPNDATIVWQSAINMMQHYGQKHVTGGMLTTSILLTSQAVEQYLHSVNLTAEDILRGLDWQMNFIDRFMSNKVRQLFGGIGRDFAAGFTPIIDQFSHNISQEIENGNLEFSGAGRKQLIDAMEATLARPNRNSVVLVGDIGVGKTELVYSLASRLIRGDTAGVLRYDQVSMPSITAISTALNKGFGLEDIMTQILAEAVHARNMMLFLDEAQLFFGNQPGAVDISQILLPIVQQSRVRLIMALTPADWHKLTSINPSLSQLFTKIEVPPADELQTIQILGDMAFGLEMQSKKFITYQALVAAYKLAARYIQGKAFPARAVDLLEDSLNYAEDQVVTEDSVARAVETITNTKVASAGAEEKTQLLNLENAIHERMVNQSRAVSVVSNALRRLRAGVRDPKRPAGSFLFLGPTGVGKTELARSLAATYFGNEANMIRLDMSEFQSKADVARLLQATSQQAAGSNFLRLVTQKPFSVILLDEIEKAHPDVLNLLLQMLDEGNLTDSAGTKINFKEAIIICTSNAGADEIRRHISAGQQLENFEHELTDELINKNIFRPELVNRFDAVVLFRPLTRPELKQIAAIMMASVNKTLADQGIKVTLSDDALEYLAEAGYDPRFGARPMRRTIQDLVENNIAQKILRGEAATGSTINFTRQDLQPVEAPVASPTQAPSEAPPVTVDQPPSIPPPKDQYR